MTGRGRLRVCRLSSIAHGSRRACQQIRAWMMAAAMLRLAACGLPEQWASEEVSEVHAETVVVLAEEITPSASAVMEDQTAAASTLASTVQPFLSDVPLAAVSYRLPLTLQYVDAEYAVFFFELSEPVSGELVFQETGQPDAALHRVPFEEPTGRHQLPIEGLASGTTYRAMVLLDGGRSQPSFQGEPWGPLQFETAQGGEVLRIGVIGDASFGDAVTYDLVERLAAADLDFVIHTGDVVDVLAYGIDPYQAYAQGYYLPFAPLLTRMPVYSIPGNHDYDADILFEGAPFYFTAFPPFSGVSRPVGEAGEHIGAYAFTRDGIQFLFLDSQVFYGAEGRAAQDAWMQERLQDPAVDTTIAIFHIGPFSCSTVHPEDRIAVRDSWVYRLEAAQVPLVLSGHYHGYERAEQNGITYIISAGGSEILYAQGAWLPQTRFAQRVSHVVVLEIGSGELHLEALFQSGERLDEIRIGLDAVE
ncbi:MAG: metallophosphoesterase [Anaerolineales bacterium]|nr:metallophosphoesterase [Anaerolineales bacterium]